MMDQIAFADESTTGELAPALRGIGRVTIAARIPWRSDFSWLASLAERLPKNAEPKARLVLPIMQRDPIVRRLVEENCSEASIFITDVAEHLRVTLSEFARLAGIPSDGAMCIDQFLRSGRFSPHLVSHLLDITRRGRLTTSAVPSIDRLLRNAARQAGLSAGRGPIDRQQLLEMSELDFREFTTRFSVALGDALDPNVQAKAIIEHAREVQYFNSGAIAFRILADVVEAEILFDRGNRRVFRSLQDAHNEVVDTLRRQTDKCASLRAGGIEEGDSALVLGLQAADLAAALARRHFETQYSDTQSAAQAVKRHFARVMLNESWLKQ